MMNMINNERVTPPKKAYDKEYSTQFRREMEYLQERGFTPTYVRRGGEYHIPTYKYTKTAQLFHAVADFYEQYNNEKVFSMLESALRTAAEIDVWAQPLT